MNIIQSIILGIVEGITEFLPISSTGHLILTGKLLGVSDDLFTKSFEIAIQFGAILAVVVLYWNKFFPLKKARAPEHIENVLDARPSTKNNLGALVLTAFLPTAILGFIFYKILKEVLLSNEMVVVWALFLGGIALILFEIWYPGSKAKLTTGQVKKLDKIDHEQRIGYKESGEITYKKAFVIGIAQALAIIPGVSRAGATIIGGLLMGIDRKTIVEFSFLLAIPTMAAATGYDLLKNASSFSLSDFHILAVGFIISFFVALASVKWLLHFIKNHTFISFGVYRIIVALLFWILVIK